MDRPACLASVVLLCAILDERRFILRFALRALGRGLTRKTLLLPCHRLDQHH